MFIYTVRHPRTDRRPETVPACDAVAAQAPEASGLVTVTESASPTDGNTTECMARRIVLPRPFPAAHEGGEQAVIRAAMLAAQHRPRAVVKASGIQYHARGRHYALFGPVAYTLACGLTWDTDGFAYDTVPAVTEGYLVGCWLPRRAGRVLHLRRDVMIDHAIVLGGTWKPVWLLCAWRGIEEMDRA